MPTDLGEAYAVGFAGVPPHMSTEDYTLWVRYRQRLVEARPTLYFDVALGGERAIEQARGSGLERMWYRINAKRADVVAVYRDRVVIIELRTQAQPNAIGRLLTYRMLWEDDPPVALPLGLELVTDHADVDVERLAAAQGIQYTVLAAGGPR